MRFETYTTIVLMISAVTNMPHKLTALVTDCIDYRKDAKNYSYVGQVRQ